MSPHEQLVAARNLIDREGWCQGVGQAGDRRCAVVALDAVNDADVVLEALRALHGDPAATFCDVVRRVVDWNDAPGRTKAEVLDLFDRAIAATAPPPDLASLNLNVNGGRKDWNALEARVQV